MLGPRGTDGVSKSTKGRAKALKPAPQVPALPAQVPDAVVPVGADLPDPGAGHEEQEQEQEQQGQKGPHALPGPAGKSSASHPETPKHRRTEEGAQARSEDEQNVCHRLEEGRGDSLPRKLEHPGQGLCMCSCVKVFGKRHDVCSKVFALFLQYPIAMSTDTPNQVLEFRRNSFLRR